MKVNYARLLRRPKIANYEAIAAAAGMNLDRTDAGSIQRSMDAKVIRLRSLIMEDLVDRGTKWPSIRHGPARHVENEAYGLGLRSEPMQLFCLFRDYGERLPKLLLAAMEAAPARDMHNGQQSAKKKNKGGRPQEHDWPGCLAAMREKFAGSLPAQKVRTTEAAEDWFIKNDGGKAPDRKSIRRQITDPLHQALAQ